MSSKDKHSLPRNEIKAHTQNRENRRVYYKQSVKGYFNSKQPTVSSYSDIRNYLEAGSGRETFDIEIDAWSKFFQGAAE
jgi:hypothetical protein